MTGAFLTAGAPAPAAAQPASLDAVRWEALSLGDGARLEFALGLPVGFDETATYPVLLALPPGAQDRAMVEASLRRYWGSQAASRGWVVVSPVAPGGRLFHRGGERSIPALLDHIEARIDVEGDRFHVAGSSNGGRSAFRIAGLHPQRVASLTVLPGYPPDADDVARLDRLAGVPIRMYVGGDDTRWVAHMRRAHEQLAELGADVELIVLDGEGHVPPSLDGPVIMDHLERVRRGGADGDARTRIDAVLDALHAAAAGADADRYFACFAPDAVFLGTDATERWTLPAFEAFARPHFASGRGWTYTVAERNVSLAADPAVAWFDELLDNEKYGRCRGTGVLLERDGRWRIAQYHLTIPVPNGLAEDVVRMIREDGSK